MSGAYTADGAGMSQPAEKDAGHEHAWDYSNTPGVDICTTCGDLRDWPKGED